MEITIIQGDTSMSVIDEDKVYHINVGEIFADEDFNCRGQITFQDVNNLAIDMKNRGQDTPITIEPYEDPNGVYKFKLIAGHRRHKAKQALQDAYPGIDFEVDEIQFVPQMTKTIEGEDLEMFEKFIDLLEDLDDVQKVYYDAEF